MGVNSHYISVIIPVYNDSINLANCLSALKKQTLDKSKFKIIVVDNGSSDDIDSVIKKYPEVDLVRELREGSYAARNKGVMSAKGDVLAFTDSDCIPARNWLERGLFSLENKDNAGFIAGKVSFFARDEKNMTGVELWEMLYNYDQEYFVKDMRFGLTANLMVERRVMDEVGLFNSDLKSAGDYEWGNRAYNKGFKIFYDEDLIVLHPARRTLKQLSQKTRRLLGGKYKIGMLNKSECLKKILIDIFPPFVTLFRLLKSKELRSVDRLDYKIKLILVYSFVRYATVYELIRLMLGGESHR